MEDQVDLASDPTIVKTTADDGPVNLLIVPKRVPRGQLAEPVFFFIGATKPGRCYHRGDDITCNVESG
jgi:hypothetical protein